MDWKRSEVGKVKATEYGIWNLGKSEAVVDDAGGWKPEAAGVTS